MSASALAGGDESTRDAFLDGRVVLLQPRGGHRAGLDAALLQAVVPFEAAGCAVDLGSGVGSVAFALASRIPQLRTIAVERDPALVALARAALALPDNAPFASRVAILEGDASARRLEREALGLGEGDADWVLMNPPFDKVGRGSVSPDPARRRAHVAGAGLLDDWCRSAAGLLKPGGFLGLIHRAHALTEVLAALQGRFGAVHVLPILPRHDEPASRIIARAVRGSRGDLRLLPPLVLHGEAGGWTREADAILRGRAELPFPRLGTGAIQPDAPS